jgi:hypothetical protein
VDGGWASDVKRRFFVSSAADRLLAFCGEEPAPEVMHEVGIANDPPTPALPQGGPRGALVAAPWYLDLDAGQHRRPRTPMREDGDLDGPGADVEAAGQTGRALRGPRES